MAPAKYVTAPELFRSRRDALNGALAFAGYSVGQDGRVRHATRESTISGARARAGRLRSVLEDRAMHSEVLKYCRAELMEENYFHAVLEAVIGVAERLREMSGLGMDGAALIKRVFSVKSQQGRATCREK